MKDDESGFVWMYSIPKDDRCLRDLQELLRLRRKELLLQKEWQAHQEELRLYHEQMYYWYTTPPPPTTEPQPKQKVDFWF